MSTNNRESPADLTALSSKHSSATMASETSGLESIVIVALQALQKEHRLKVEVEETLPTTTTTPLLPPPAMNSARRVVSTDTIDGNECVGENIPPYLPPQVKEETISSAKASDLTPCAPPAESVTRAVVPSSPSPSPAPSEIAVNDSPILTGDISPKAADFSRILADPEGWLLQTENLFAKLPTVDRSSDNDGDIIVHPNDVLCGRGGETNHHPGNIRYRSLVKAYQKLYLLAKRRDKPKIAQCIVVSVRGVNGSFLKRTKSSNKAGGSAWVDVGNVKAREKTSQALREGAPNLRENVNPPVTTSATNDNIAASGRQVPVSDRIESIATPATTTTTLPKSTPTALEAMMGWRMATASFKIDNSTTNANGSSSSAPPVSSSSSLPPSDTDTDALTAQVFTKAAAQLMQHPAFHQLDQGRQQEAILFELSNAKAAVKSATRTSTSTGTTTPANIQEQGRSSPMIPTSSMKQQQRPQSQQHHQPYHPHEYPYYHPGQHHYYPHMYPGYWQDGNVSNLKNPSSMDKKSDQSVSLPSSKIAPSQVDKNVDLQIMYRELLVAKANASAGSSSSLVSANKKDDKIIPTDAASEHRRKMKKRPAPSSSPNVHSMDSAALPTISPTVVSDTGSDVSSSSSASSCNATINIVKDDKIEAIASVSRGGSRLKRLKSRMKDDFD